MSLLLWNPKSLVRPNTYCSGDHAKIIEQEKIHREAICDYLQGSIKQSDDDSDDDEDETAALMLELERIKKEREDDAARKVKEDKDRSEAEKKDAMLRGNPLLGGGGFGVKRRYGTRPELWL